MLKDYDRGFKIMIAGSQGVGKSSLLSRYVDNIWSGNLLSQSGLISNLRPPPSITVEKVKLQIWDTAGS